MTFLYKCKISIYNDTYNLNCIGTNGKTRTIVFRGSEKSFKLFLKRVKATDQTTQPRTKKALTYAQMISQAKDGSDPFVYIYSHMLPKQDIIKEHISFFNSNLTAKEYIYES